jgi:signal transduction histidine kinase/CheY-like chemotaxis protein
MSVVPTLRRPPGQRSLPILVLVLGLASVGLLLATDWMRIRLVQQNFVVAKTLARVATALANSHLWIEELVTGDAVGTAVIEENLSRSRAWVELLLIGGTTEDGFTVRPLEDRSERVRVLDLRSGIDSLALLSRQRIEGFRANAAVGPGSALDQEYDRLYGRLVVEVEELDLAARARLASEQRRFRTLFGLLVAAWLSLIGVAAFGLASRERHRHQAEEALRQSEARLLRSQKLEAVGRLAGGIAHDINNYLAAITGHCELVKLKEKAESPVIAKMDAIIGTAMSASGLIKRLLAFSRRQPTQPEVVGLNHVIEHLEPMLQRLIGEDIELALVLEPKVWPVRIDVSQLEQVIFNLVVNAREAMPRGGKVTIETRNVAEPVLGGGAKAPGESVLLAVTDNGEGIPPEVQEKIFEPFFTTKDHQGNSGLGLSTVYGIVEQHAGQLSVYSEPQHGTCFKIYFPRVGGEAREPTWPRHGTPLARGTGSLMLVEDNLEFLSSTSELLRTLGYQVTAVANATDALERFGQQTIDLIVTDVVLPDLSGRDLVTRLAERGHRPRVLFISGYTASVVLNHGVTEAEVDFLQKPFTASQLAQKIREILDRAARGGLRGGAPSRGRAYPMASSFSTVASFMRDIARLALAFVTTR